MHQHRRTHAPNPTGPAKLAQAYAVAVAAGDDEKAARILGVSLGSARLAKKRHLGAAATVGRRSNAPERATDGHLPWGLLGYGPLSNRQRHGLRDGSARPSKSDAGGASIPPATGAAKYSMRPCRLIAVLT